ncbi:type I restriction endonuclease subunit S [Macrococcoides caseolyticum]|uniref:restriction endonuclease subunit S n=1 Tax=Macrococcoides caseolyticum TaxID=69966 RepID=UPI000C3438C5|nr:restriction endonuclease subunit S [Macrococcus caseolyticus]PKE36015.1 type I restriction endonuclease subunit S [Macrococcus caseolyticus]
MFLKNVNKHYNLGKDTYTWEQRELGEVVKINSGRDYKHLSVGKIPVYGTGGLMLYVNEALSTNQDAIGIGRKGTINKPYILKAPFWTVDTLFFVVPNININLYFVFNIFEKINWKAKDESTGVPSLSKLTISNTKIFSPNIEEQMQIGKLTKELDETITLLQRE